MPRRHADKPRPDDGAAPACRRRNRAWIKTAEGISRLSKKEQRFGVAQRLEARAANERCLRRIGRSAVHELTETFNAGGLSLRQYDLLSRLSPTAQKKALQEEERRKEGQSRAARVIHLMLAHKERAIDLTAIEAKIIASIHGLRDRRNPTAHSLSALEHRH
jgi:hypothetical protein